MNTRYFLTIFLFQLLFASSCVKEHPDEINDPVPVRFAIYTADNTRISDDVWDIGDRIGIYMIRTGTVLSESTIWDFSANRLYHTPDGSGDFVPFTEDQTLFYPENGRYVDFLAYYPYTNAVSTNFTISLDVTDQTNPDKLDLLYSNNVKGKNFTDPVADLNFEHKLTKLEFNFVPDGELTAAELQGLQFTISGINTTAEFSLANGQLVYKGATGDISPQVTPNGRYSEVILLPTPAIPEANRKLKVYLPSYNKTLETEIAATEVYEAGWKNIYTVKVSHNKVEYAVSNITQWVLVEDDDRISYPNETLTLPNCYIVKPGNYQDIPIIKAYAVWETDIPLNPKYVDLEGDVTVGLIWEESAGLISNIELYGRGKQASMTVYTDATKAPGNALVGAYIGGTLRWSWHIWVTDYDPDGQQNGVTYNYHNGTKNHTFMDRNLGALDTSPGSITSIGMYYQAGRKDPFPRPANLSASGSYNHVPLYNASGQLINYSTAATSAEPNMGNSITNPFTFYYADPYASGSDVTEWYSSNPQQVYNYQWNTFAGYKAMYDPCPAGWRVPKGGVSADNLSPWYKAGVNTTDKFVAGVGADFNNPSYNLGFYPAAGMIALTDGSYSQIGEAGFYWMSTTTIRNTLYSHYGNFFRVSNILNYNGATRRSYGMQVRCVKDE